MKLTWGFGNHKDEEAMTAGAAPAASAEPAAGTAEAADDDVEARLLDLLSEITGDDDVREHRDEDLFALGMLDSMAAIELLVDIEDSFGVRIAPTELPREEMNTVNLIIEQVQKRL